MMNKRILIPLCAAALVGSTLVAVPAAFAQDQQAGTNQGFFSKLVQRIEQFFGYQSPQNPQPQTNFPTPPNGTPMPTPSGIPPTGMPQGGPQGFSGEARLTQLVQEGKITDAQKAAILREQQTIQAKIQAAMDELKAWAKAQGIDESYVTFGNMGVQQPPQPNGQGSQQNM